VGPHHDQVDPGLVGVLQNFLGRLAEPDLAAGIQPRRLRGVDDRRDVVFPFVFEALDRPADVEGHPLEAADVDDVQRRCRRAVLLREFNRVFGRPPRYIAPVGRHEYLVVHHI
jgi:hypothetical protein